VFPVRDDETVGAAVLSFAVVAGVLTVTPGLDTALVRRAALTQRRRDALATAAGVVAGLLVGGAAAAMGVSALLAASRVAYDVLRYAGAACMVWLGARPLWGAVRGRPGGADPRSDVRWPSAWQAARRGLLTNLLNPKVGAVYVALLPQFLPAGAEPLVVGLLLAGVHGLLGMAWFTGLTYAAAALGG
jgi:threonine/homoserine/homoserine lactone efflux protein